MTENKDPNEAAIADRVARLVRAERTGVLPLRIWPDEALKSAAAPVNAEELGDQLKAIVDRMLSTMYMTGGVGLAGPQVGYMKRVFVMDSDPRGRKPRVFINPVIDKASPVMLSQIEGCLSFPGLRQSVQRPAQVIVTYIDENFQAQRDVMAGLEARIAQHEIEHLDGKTFLDSMTPNQRAYALREITRARKKDAVRGRSSSIKKEAVKAAKKSQRRRR